MIFMKDDILLVVDIIVWIVGFEDYVVIVGGGFFGMLFVINLMWYDGLCVMLIEWCLC